MSLLSSMRTVIFTVCSDASELLMRATGLPPSIVSKYMKTRGLVQIIVQKTQRRTHPGECLWTKNREVDYKVAAYVYDGSPNREL